jgi:LysM repeat protein
MVGLVISFLLLLTTINPEPFDWTKKDNSLQRAENLANNNFKSRNHSQNNQLSPSETGFWIGRFPEPGSSGGLKILNTQDSEEPDSLIHEVQPGDALSIIAYRYGASLLAILRANPGITHPNRIFPGQRLTIPVREDGRPLVTLLHQSGPPSTVLHLEASVLLGSSPVDISVGRWREEPEHVGTFMTRDNGTLIAQVTIPQTAEMNELWFVRVSASDNVGTVMLQGEARFFIRPELTETRPNITFWPLSGSPGMEVHVVAAHLPPEKLFELSFKGWEMDHQPDQIVRSEINGTFGARLLVPEEAQTSQEWVIIARMLDEPHLEITSDIFHIR